LLEPAEQGYPVAWFQPTYKSLLEVWRAVKRAMKPATVSVSEQDKRIELATGGVIEFWSLDRDPEGCRGRKYKRVIVNEAAKCRELELAWTQAIRPTLTDYKGDAWFPSTPRGRDYYHELFSRGQDALGFPQWKSWQLPTSDNPKIDAAEIEEAKRDLPSTVFQQEYLALFLDVAGRFFDEWEPERWVTDYDEESGQFVERKWPWHVCDPFQVPDWWDAWFAVDYGTTPDQPTFGAVLFVIDEHGSMYAIDEVYAAGLEAPEQAQAVLEMLGRNGMASPTDPKKPKECLWTISPRVKMSPMDWASTFPPTDAQERKGKYPVEYYWERGLKMIVRAVKDRRAGWQEFKRVLHDYRVERDQHGEYPLPMFSAFRGKCSHFIRTIPLLVRSETDPEDIEGGNLKGGERKQEDHLADVGRYAFMTRPRPSKNPNAPKPYEPRHPFGDESRLPPALRQDRPQVRYE
jgi:hypothetical protein